MPATQSFGYAAILKLMKANSKTKKIAAAMLFLCTTAVILLTRPREEMLTQELSAATPGPELSYVTPTSRDLKSQVDFSVAHEDETTRPPAITEEQKLSLAYRVHTEPAAVYNKYIVDAELGDAKAQFIVAQALRACPSRQLTEAEAQSLKYDHGFTQVIKDDLAELWSRCNALFVQLPGTDLRAAYHSWLETASENGSAIARTQNDLTFSPGALDKEHYSRLFPKAFEEAGDDQYLRGQVYNSLVMYLSEYGNWQDEQSAAWNILSCKVDPGCSETGLLSQYRADYYPHEVEFIQKKAETYLEAIDQKDYGSLELDLIVEPP